MLRRFPMIALLLLCHVLVAHAGEPKGGKASIQAGRIERIINLYEPDTECRQAYPTCVKDRKGASYRKNSTIQLAPGSSLPIRQGQWFMEVAFRNDGDRDAYCYITQKTGQEIKLLNKDNRYKVPAGTQSDVLAEFEITMPDARISVYQSDTPLDLKLFNPRIKLKGGIVLVPPVDLITGK